MVMSLEYLAYGVLGWNYGSLHTMGRFHSRFDSIITKIIFNVLKFCKKLWFKLLLYIFLKLMKFVLV